MIIWRRHSPPCSSTDRTDSKCGCLIYHEFRVNGKRFRRTLKTRNWQKALSIARKNEIDGIKKDIPTVEQACEKYLQDAQARQLREPTLYKFKLLFRQLQKFTDDKGIVFISEITIDDLRRFRAGWPNRNFAARKKLEATRAFFRFCNISGWIASNPADSLKPGKTTDLKIVPITREEFDKVLKTCDSYPNKRNAVRLKAMILVMRYTGLRIRDVVTLRKDHIRDDKLFLRTAKTGTSVFCPLPNVVLDGLNRIDAGASSHYFWSGESKPKSAVGDYQRALRRLFILAETPRLFAHLFRHTLATELLTAGNSLETVAALLGNSPKIVEKHYHHWVKGRQDKLEKAVKNSWAQLGTVDHVGA